MGALSVSSPLLLRHIFRPPLLTPPLLLHSFLGVSQTFQTSPFSTSFASTPSFSSQSHSLSSFCYFSLSSSPLHSITEFNSLTQTSIDEHIHDDDEDEDEEFESKSEDSEVEEEREPRPQSSFLDSSRLMTYNEMLSKLPSLTIKEKKELASYAHSLGKKLKSQQVGKSGVTDAVATALIETLESKELLKLKIHGNCPGELDDVVNQLEASTGSVIVSRIGRTIILYRPSLTKFKAEEKKKLNQRIYAKKQLAWRSAQQHRRSAPRESGPASRGRGQRGSSRY